MDEKKEEKKELKKEKLNGREKGKKEEKENVARKLLKQKIDINVIIHATGLTKEEVEKL